MSLVTSTAANHALASQLDAAVVAASILAAKYRAIGPGSPPGFRNAASSRYGSGAGSGAARGADSGFATGWLLPLLTDAAPWTVFGTSCSPTGSTVLII